MIPMPLLKKQVEQHPYPLLFVTISGAHLYGFPSPDSDFDLRGVHVLPLRDVVGLDPGTETVEVSRVAEGLELDLVTHDLKKFIGLILRKNGYVLEQLYSPISTISSGQTWPGPSTRCSPTRICNSIKQNTTAFATSFSERSTPARCRMRPRQEHR